MRKIIVLDAISEEGSDMGDSRLCRSFEKEMFEKTRIKECLKELANMLLLRQVNGTWSLEEIIVSAIQWIYIAKDLCCTFIFRNKRVALLRE